MANNYCLFAEAIECGSVQEAEWLENQVETREGESGQACEVHRDGTTVHLYSEENCDLELLCDILLDYHLKYKTPPIIVTWGYTCSQPRSGEFGGGAFVIKKGKAKWLDARHWANKLVDKK
jgi:hypothetical protein